MLRRQTTPKSLEDQLEIIDGKLSNDITMLDSVYTDAPDKLDSRAQEAYILTNNAGTDVETTRDIISGAEGLVHVYKAMSPAGTRDNEEICDLSGTERCCPNVWPL